MNSTQTARGISIIVAVVIIAALSLGREVLVPVILAGLFCFILTPLVNRLERWHVPRVPAVLATASVAFAIIGLIGYIGSGQLIDLAYRLPSYKKNISAKILAFHLPKEGPWSKVTQTFRELRAEATGTADGGAANSAASAVQSPKEKKAMPVEVVSSPDDVGDVVQNTISPALHPVGEAFIIVVFVIFMLIKKEDLRNRIIHLAGRDRLSLTTRALDEAGERVSKYLVMQVIVNASFGLIIGVGLYFIGVPNAILWGLLAAVLRFIPYIGAWIAAAFPIALAVAVSTNWTMPILALALFAGTELLVANVVEPWLYGTHTGLSPVAILVAAVFWTWLWGSVGLLLSTPLTVCVAVLGKHIPALAFLDVLLGDEPSLPASDRYYQRLLARDPDEAKLIADEFLETQHRVELFEQVFAVAVMAAESDEAAGKLDKEGREFVFKAVREQTRERLGADYVESDPATAQILILPAEDEGDELLGELLAAMLAPTYRAHVAVWSMLANEKADLTLGQPPIVCISETSRHNHAHTEYLARRVRARVPETTIVAGLWAMQMPEPKLRSLARKLESNRVVTDLESACQELRGAVV